jgi:hypothetical protein
MKKHLLGFCVALFFAFTSFYISPIQFRQIGVGIGTTEDYIGDCHFYPYESTHFTRLSLSICFFENEAQTKNHSLKLDNKSSKIIEQEIEIKLGNNESIKRKMLGFEQNEIQFFCIIREYENAVTEICSTSLRHILEFEQQKGKG